MRSASCVEGISQRECSVKLARDTSLQRNHLGNQTIVATFVVTNWKR
jgi:hypothetical protein